MKRLYFWMFAVILFSGCGGEEYYSTPEKTLQRYVDNRMMMTREQYEACLNTFTKEDREWFEKNFLTLCGKLYGPECPGDNIAAAVAVWLDVFEPYGPKSAEVSSSEIQDDTAILTVRDKQIPFVKARGNWKIKGIFNAEKLKVQYPQIAGS